MLSHCNFSTCSSVSVYQKCACLCVAVSCRNHSVHYFTEFKVPYCWTSVKGGAHTRFVDALHVHISTKHVWVLPLMKVQWYTTSNVAMRSNIWQNKLRILHYPRVHFFHSSITHADENCYVCCFCIFWTLSLHESKLKIFFHIMLLHNSFGSLGNNLTEEYQHTYSHVYTLSIGVYIQFISHWGSKLWLDLYHIVRQQTMTQFILTPLFETHLFLFWIYNLQPDVPVVV